MKPFEGKFPLVFSYSLVIAAALLRIELSSPFNVVPIFSCLLFFAASRQAREFVLPVSLLVGVDIFMTTHRYGFPLTAVAAVTWAWYLLAMLLGSGLLRTSRSWPRIAVCSLLASVSFFLASNFAVWAVWQMYPRTVAGLGACYVAALPFFRNSVTSELCFSLLLFGLTSRVRSLAVMEITRQAPVKEFNFVGVNHGSV
ncbi:MAG: DUF6580 family putative transport protein [Terracidiphilus sp.]|jgi:hypothetical protein